jgi:ABC-type Fe3+/spermidine/putrescine transport system ATPase subunit
VIEAGRILQIGTPAEVWGEPRTSAVARLLGFTNVAPARVAAGRLLTPWGDLGPAPAPAGAVLVRPDGVRPDPRGPIEGTVVGRSFAGAHTRLRVAVPDAPDLDLEVPDSEAAIPALGTAIRLRIAPQAVRALPT